MSELAPEVQRARFRLMLDHPFLASAVARLPLREADSTDVPTMATDGYRILYSLEFARSLTPDECVGVLAHEVLHCVFGHLERRQSRDPVLWNVAIDYATNECLVACGFTLPSSRLWDAKYANLTAEEIYELLYQTVPPKRLKGFDLHLSPDLGIARAYRDVSDPSPGELGDLRQQLAREVISKLPGRLPALWKQELERLESRRVPWQELLARFFTATLQSDFRLFPPNKRHLWQGLYLPSVGGLGPRQVVVAIDTSGSMRTSDLQLILAEVDAFRAVAACELRLIQADAAIASDRHFDPWDLAHPDPGPSTVVGRGGTSFRPVFEAIEQQAGQSGYLPDCLVYFTDGYGEFPVKAPAYPVLWVAVESSKATFPVGEVLRF